MGYGCELSKPTTFTAALPVISSPWRHRQRSESPSSANLCPQPARKLDTRSRPACAYLFLKQIPHDGSTLLCAHSPAAVAQVESLLCPPRPRLGPRSQVVIAPVPQIQRRWH